MGNEAGIQCGPAVCLYPAGSGGPLKGDSSSGLTAAIITSIISQ